MSGGVRNACCQNLVMTATGRWGHHAAAADVLLQGRSSRALGPNWALAAAG